MLSRVANSIYWMGRYLERAENTARLVNVNSHLLLDLPRRVKLGWEPIVDILSNRELFHSFHEEVNEHNVVNFIIEDKENLGSIISSLSAARENARTIREIIPRESWEQINSIYLQASENKEAIYSRRQRYEYLKNIILSNQLITGLLAGTMTHDEGYKFLRIGRNVERADMTTRIIDVRSASLLPDLEHEQTAFENIQWMGVLKSLTGYQMYRREVRLRISRPDVLKFLLLQEKFPRSVSHTLNQVDECVATLPKSEHVHSSIGVVKKQLLQAKPESLKQDKLHEFIDEIQIGLSDIHNELSRVYF